MTDLRTQQAREIRPPVPRLAVTGFQAASSETSGGGAHIFERGLGPMRLCVKAPVIDELGQSAVDVGVKSARAKPAPVSGSELTFSKTCTSAMPRSIDPVHRGVGRRSG